MLTKSPGSSLGSFKLAPMCVSTIEQATTALICRGGYKCPGKVEHDGYCCKHKYLSVVLEVKPPRQPIRQVSKKKAKELRGQRPERDLQREWFDEIEIKECKDGGTHCWNCGEFIPQPFIKAATAHVLPKRDNQFPSVATHPVNYMILGAGCGCHNEYDRSWKDASKMQVWKIAIERLGLMYYDITPIERKKVPDVFFKSPDAIQVSQSTINL